MVIILDNYIFACVDIGHEIGELTSGASSH